MHPTRRNFIVLGGLNAAALAISPPGSAQETDTAPAAGPAPAFVIITGKANIPEANRAAFHEIAVKQVTNSRLEEGCLSYAYYEDAMSPGTFLFFEQWKDQAAIDFHFKQAYCLEFITKARELAAAPPEIKIYPVVAR